MSSTSACRGSQETRCSSISTRARSDGPMHDFTYLDLDYVRTVSPATDLKVLAMTLPAMLGSQRGS